MSRSESQEDPPGQCILVVPCYNEERRLCSDEFLAFLESYPNFDFLFVDDGSTDATRQLLENTRNLNERQVDLLGLNRNVGKAEAVRRGLQVAAGKKPKFVGYWDADLSTPLEEAVNFLQLLERRPEVDLVIGSRVKLLGRQVSRRPIRHYLGRVFATLASFSLGLPVYDTQCGAKIFRLTPTLMEAIAQPFCSRWIFDVELLDRFLHPQDTPFDSRMALKIVEHPLMKWEDVEGSKLRAHHCVRALWDLLRIRWLSRRRRRQTKATLASSPERAPRH